jgi:hypothetical protein
MGSDGISDSKAKAQRLFSDKSNQEKENQMSDWVTMDKKKRDETPRSLVGIQPRHLRLVQFHLNNYLRLLCESGGEDDLVTTVSELRYLDGLISGIMGDNDHGQE